MLIKEKFFNTNPACLAQAMATCKNMTSCNFYLNTWRQIKFDACKKKNVRCNRKATFHYKGKLQDVFRIGLNEIKYDSKQHFYLHYHVAATDMKALCKKQTALQPAVYLGFAARGDKLSLSAPQPVRGGIK